MKIMEAGGMVVVDCRSCAPQIGSMGALVGSSARIGRYADLEHVVKLPPEAMQWSTVPPEPEEEPTQLCYWERQIQQNPWLVLILGCPLAASLEGGISPAT